MMSSGLPARRRRQFVTGTPRVEPALDIFMRNGASGIGVFDAFIDQALHVPLAFDSESIQALAYFAADPVEG
jgi:hypothetical protein